MGGRLIPHPFEQRRPARDIERGLRCGCRDFSKIRKDEKMKLEFFCNVKAWGVGVFLDLNHRDFGIMLGPFSLYLVKAGGK